MMPLALLTPEMAGLALFVLAAFIGFEVITKVPATLHTPLMSGANAISGIILVGAVLVAAAQESTLGTLLGLLGVFLATINVVGGFLVTDRMLRMFKKKPSPPGGDAGGGGGGA